MPLQETAPLITTKRVKIVEDNDFGWGANTAALFIDRCKNKFKQEPTTTNINIEPYQNVTFDPNKLALSKTLSFTVSEEDLTHLTSQMLKITTNPHWVARLLKPLDDELGKLMKSSGINFTEDELPYYLIAGMGHFVPGPPPEDYQPRQKARQLDALLLKREKSVGVNLEGDTPKFVDVIKAEEVNTFVADGHLFAEIGQVKRLLMHGIQPHRLMFDALCSAIDCNELDLTLSNGTRLSFRQLLELMIWTKYEDGQNQNLWNFVLDTTEDIYNLNEKALQIKIRAYLLNPAFYNFSCRSPHVLTSLILCFGKELELPNLQYYLLDTHWKQAYRMVGRIIHSKEGQETLAKVPKDIIYTYCMEALSTPLGGPGAFFTRFVFALTEKMVKENSKYQPYSERYSKNIVRKVAPASSVGHYESWDAYLLEKKRDLTKLASATPDNDFIFACGTGQVEVMQSSLDELQLPETLLTGLRVAVKFNQPEILKFLINNKLDSFGPRVLEKGLVQAAEFGHNDIIAVFIEAGGIDINFANNQKNIDFIAASVAAFKTLMGVDALFPFSFISSLPQVIEAFPITPPLIKTIENGHKHTVEYLLSKGIHFERELSLFDNDTALTTAIKHGHKEIAILLLKQNPSKQWLMHKNSEDEPLSAYELAKRKGWDDICEHIARLSSNQSAEDNSLENTASLLAKRGIFKQTTPDGSAAPVEADKALGEEEQRDNSVYY
ncbi:MAG: ankyrin repeat domain-containing protein [Gammaproteobacteria bacterium]